MKLFLTAICLSLLGFLTSCSPNAGNRDSHAHDSGRPAPDFPTNVTMYEVKGVLREIRAEGWKALIAHEDIPGYMEAMTMQLDVKDTNELRGLLPGDQISFRMLVTDDDGWIDRVKRIGSTVASNPAPTPPVIAVDQLNPGSLLPDFTLTNQFGQPMHLKDFKGRAFAFTFIFTRCPFPTFCPRMNNNFSETQRLLALDNTRTNWSLSCERKQPASKRPIVRRAASSAGFFSFWELPPRNCCFQRWRLSVWHWD